jgi:hypothetical protein
MVPVANRLRNIATDLARLASSREFASQRTQLSALAARVEAEADALERTDHEAPIGSGRC